MEFFIVILVLLPFIIFSSNRNYNNKKKIQRHWIEGGLDAEAYEKLYPHKPLKERSFNKN